MGFFDDLDKVAAPVPDSAEVDTSSTALATVLDKLASGWVWEGMLSRKVQQRSGQDVSSIEQRVQIAHRGGRFCVTHSRVELRRNRALGAEVTSDRQYDREGLVEMLRDQPLVARKLVLAAGGKVDPDRPDGESALDGGER